MSNDSFMDWVFAHFQLVIGAGALVVYTLTSLWKKAAANARADAARNGRPAQSSRGLRDADQTQENAEHTRRIQAEIRRKIAERQAAANRPVRPAGGQSPAKTAQPLRPSQAPSIPAAQAPALPEDVWRRERETAAPYAQDSVRERQARETADVLERQRGLAEQLAALEQQHRTTGVRERESPATWAQSAVTSQRSGYDVEFLRELRKASSLRKAVILQEVLSPPVGLR